PPLGVDDKTVTEEGIGHLDRRLQYAPGVVAQVHAQPLELALLLERGETAAYLVSGIVLGLGDAPVGVTRLQGIGAHTAHADDCPLQLHIEGPTGATHQGQGDLRASGAAHALDRVHQAHALDRMIIYLDDQVPRLDTGPRGRGVVDRR